MNHTQLKAFDAVVREGSFSRAGIRLGKAWLSTSESSASHIRGSRSRDSDLEF